MPSGVPVFLVLQQSAGNATLTTNGCARQQLAAVVDILQFHMFTTTHKPHTNKGIYKLVTCLITGSLERRSALVSSA